MILDYTTNTIEQFDTITENHYNPIYHSHESGFFKKNTQHCRFCSEKLIVVHKEGEFSGTIHDDLEIVYDCKNCGWWYYKSAEAIYVGEGSFLHSGVYFWGMLRAYSDNSKNIPLSTLRTEIKKRPDLIYNLHPRKFEELVGSVFTDFFNCEVKHVGKTNDGGIDLILVRSDSDIIIQVKRREKPNSTEGVSVIRELVGAMQLAEKRNGIFVTSANKFSNKAIVASKKAESLNIVDKLELIDYKKFVDALCLVSTKIERPWKGLIGGS